MTATKTLNAQLNGVELSFTEKPSSAIIEALKNAGYRWHNVKKIWYAKQNEKTLTIADSLSGSQETATTDKAIKTEKAVTMSLYERTQFTPGTTNKNKYNYNFVGSNYTPGQTAKEKAAIMRTHLKARFPEVKFSITSDYNSIDIKIMSSPYQKLSLAYDSELSSRDYRKYEEDNNKELNAILNYCKLYRNSFNYDDSDSMTDYFDVGFYGNAEIYYNYTQTEQTEAIQADIEAFRAATEAATIAKEEEAHREYLRMMEERAEDEKRAQAAEIIRKEQIKLINNNVMYDDLNTDIQYMIYNAKFAHLNKNNTMSEYAEEVNKGEYSNEDIKITREIHFTSAEALEAFKNNLLSDFDFITGTGGSYTDDPRFSSMTDYSKMTSEERDTVKFYLQGAAVYYNNALQFVIDAQGFSYARYVGLTDEAKRGAIPAEAEKTSEILEDIKTADIVESISAEVIAQYGLADNWQGNTQYYKLMLEALKRDNINLTHEVIRQITIEELKIQLYTLISWSPELPEQFADAAITEGEKITIYYMSDFGGIVENRITFDSFTPCKYAQYDKAIKLIFTPEGKRKQYYNYFYGGKGLIIFKGWHNLPERVLWDIDEKPGIITRMSKFTSCDRTQFDEIIKHFSSIGIEPIIRDKTKR